MRRGEVTPFYTPQPDVNSNQAEDSMHTTNVQQCLLDISNISIVSTLWTPMRGVDNMEVQCRNVQSVPCPRCPGQWRVVPSSGVMVPPPARIQPLVLARPATCAALTSQLIVTTTTTTIQLQHTAACHQPPLLSLLGHGWV